MDIALILRLMPALFSLLNDPIIKEALAKLGQLHFPDITPDAAPAAAVAYFDVNATMWVQTALNMLGDGVLVSGVNDDKTKAAVRAFQSKNGLTADGWAGELTQTKLREVIGAKKTV